jgi:spore coat protein GerQ
MENIQPPNFYNSPYPPMDMMYQFPQNGGINPPYPNKNEPLREETNKEDTDDSSNYFTKYLSKNIGKQVSLYCSFTDSADWHDRIFEGKLVSAGDDYVIIDEYKIKKEIMILSVYIHYIEFDK